MNRIIITVSLALAVLAGSATTAAAAGRTCSPDIKRFCAGVASGQGRIKACLDEHLDELSDGCRALRGDPARAGVVKQTCAPDVKKWCKNVKSGAGRMKACLDSHADDLSEGCRLLRGDQQVRVSAFKAACEADIQKECPNVESGKGRRLSCLDKNWSRISEGCRAVIDDEVEARMVASGPCAGDIQKVCRDTIPGSSRMRECLKEHGKDLNPACRDRIGAKAH